MKNSLGTREPEAVQYFNRGMVNNSAVTKSWIYVMKTEIPEKFLHKCTLRAFWPFYFLPGHNAPSLFQVHGILYRTGGNYFLSYTEFGPPEKDWLDSYEDVNTLHRPRKNFSQCFAKKYGAVLGWMEHGESSVFMAHLVRNFSSGTTSRSTELDHFFLMQAKCFWVLNWNWLNLQDF